MSFWQDAYQTTPPWDIGRPQPALVKLVKDGELKRGMVLDVGCGTGENALYVAQMGFSVIGVDVAKQALESARSKAVERGVKADFRLANALSLEFENGFFQNVLDSGLFHTFSNNERPVFAKQVARVLGRGGRYFMLCFSEKEPTDWGGPRRVTKSEVENTFSTSFHINYIRDEFFATRIHDKGGRAYLVSATKLD